MLRIKALLTVTTELKADLEGDETPLEYMKYVTNEGLKQYMKDYDPDLMYEIPRVQIVRVEIETD